MSLLPMKMVKSLSCLLQMLGLHGLHLEWKTLRKTRVSEANPSWERHDRTHLPRRAIGWSSRLAQGEDLTSHNAPSYTHSRGFFHQCPASTIDLVGVEAVKECTHVCSWS